MCRGAFPFFEWLFFLARFPYRNSPENCARLPAAEEKASLFSWQGSGRGCYHFPHARTLLFASEQIDPLRHDIILGAIPFSRRRLSVHAQRKLMGFSVSRSFPVFQQPVHDLDYLRRWRPCF